MCCTSLQTVHIFACTLSLVFWGRKGKMRKKRQLLASLLTTTIFRYTLDQAASFGPPHTVSHAWVIQKVIILFPWLPECTCVSWEREGARQKRGKEKKPGAIFLGFLPPEPESFNSHLFTFKVSELGYTRGCSDFSSREETPYTRRNQHSGCLPCPSFAFTGISSYWVFYIW